MAPGILLIQLLGGCLFGGERSDVMAYKESMAPVLQKNGILAQEFLEVASRVKKGELDGSATAERFRRNAVPLAQEIATRAATVEPDTDTLAAAHATLVKAWSNRAIAYRDLATAWNAADAGAYDAARQRDLQVRYDELAYMQAVNAVCIQYGVVIDLYP